MMINVHSLALFDAVDIVVIDIFLPGEVLKWK